MIDIVLVTLLVLGVLIYLVFSFLGEFRNSDGDKKKQLIITIIIIFLVIVFISYIVQAWKF